MSKEVTWDKPLAYNYFGRNPVKISFNDDDTDGFSNSLKFAPNTDKLFGTSNMSTKLRNSITSAKLISSGSSFRASTAGSNISSNGGGGGGRPSGLNSPITRPGSDMRGSAVGTGSSSGSFVGNGGRTLNSSSGRW